MSWTSRSTAPIFRALLCSGLVAAFALPAAADAPIKALYLQQPIVFSHVSGAGASTTVGINDPGLRALLRATGASITWRPGERYVLMTTAAPVVVSFAVGDRRYDVGPVVLQASVAPFLAGSEVYLPFNELLRSLDLAVRPDGATWILQPQLASLDVRSWGNRADVVVRGGIPLRPRIVQDAPGAVIYEFDGVGTALTGTRNVNAGGIRSIAVSQSGPARNPKTIVNVQLLPGASHDVPRSDDGRDIVVSFGPAGWTAQVPFGQTSPPPAAASNGEQSQTPNGNVPGAPASGAAAVTGVTVAPSSDGYAVTIAVSGNAAFEWHRLRDPDNRFWVDVKNAQLRTPAIDQTEPDPLGALRVRQIDPTTVRIALSLTGPKALAISPATTGLSVDIGSNDVADAPRAGSGSVGTTIASSEQTAPVTPAPGNESASSWSDAGNGWKFGPRSSYVPTNPRLIVIDPGHGGSDRGSSRHGVDEAGLALDMSKRLRDILVARGWQVRMTHDTDVDVYQPNDSAHDELQARVDVANHAGARMFVSIHANAYINSGPYGTTYYISKPGDLGLAQAIERSLSSDGTKDDGIVRAHLYVTLHSLMPAVLIETAFISNPNDFALLNSSAWRQQVAQSIADGIDRYAAQYPVSNQPAQ